MLNLHKNTFRVEILTSVENSIGNTIANLEIRDRFIYKDIRENKKFAKELKIITGNETVPCLITGTGPMKEAKDIRKFLISKFT